MRYLFALALTIAGPALADEHAHHHGHDHAAMKPPVERPKVFLDKSRRIVDYQLKRLENERLIWVERADTDAKYVPVYEALLNRPGISADVKDESVAALTKLTGTSRAAVLFSAISSLEDDKASKRLRRDLTASLMQTPAESLAAETGLLEQMRASDDAFVRSAAIAASAVAGIEVPDSTESQDLIDSLNAIPLVPSQQYRDDAKPKVLAAVQSTDTSVQKTAIDTLRFIKRDAAATFDALVPLIANQSVRANVVRTLKTIPAESRRVETSRAAATTLVELAESTPAKKRTTDDFLAAAELADSLFGRLPIEEGRALRARLRDVAVRVVRIKTVEEEMRYDTPYFAVQAGRPVQVLLENHDQMPHNLVITTPGQMKFVAEQCLGRGMNGHNGKQYVANMEEILFATHMVPADQSERLTFVAPTQPGEYPYVCTFPRHWMRMYGVMVVVEDLDAYAAAPFKPKDPIGSTREFVNKWTTADFKGEIESGLRGRSPAIGKKLFAEATCALCHQVDGVGGKVGPSLNGVGAKWKGNHDEVFREIVEPSYRVDDKYKMQTVITDEGETLSGIIVAQDKDTISLLSNPEAKEPTIVDRGTIEEMVPSPVSIMPKGLLDRFTRDEIFEILAYIESAKAQP